RNTIPIHNFHSRSLSQTPTAMAPLHSVRSATIRGGPSGLSLPGTGHTKSAPPRQTSPKKSQGTKKSKSASAPRPKSILVAPRGSTKTSKKSGHRVQFAENNETAEADDDHCAEQNDTFHILGFIWPFDCPDFIWPFEFPDLAQLKDLCIARVVDTGVLSLDYNALLREQTRKAPQNAVEILCNDVFVLVFEFLQSKQEAGAAIDTIAELTKEVDRLTDFALPGHIKGDGMCDYHADLNAMMNAEEVTVFERVGADDCSITNVNFFLSPEALEVKDMGPQFIHEYLNPMRRGSTEVQF
ncbi:hypothetical protein FRC01_008710, partial [Tulasnella sp. 417]